MQSPRVFLSFVWSRIHSRSFAILGCLVFLFPAEASFAVQVVESDICVYGGTSGGVAAAVQAARLGKQVVLVSMNQHLGGMTSGGLGWTDYGNRNAIGGISREFYRRVGVYYNQSESWTFEPHVAEETFSNMLWEASVPVYFQRRLASVVKDGQRLRELVMENGDVFRARMFIDTTYEGDLMAMAGVTFTWGRESVDTYGESLSGVRANTPQHQFQVPVDPYVIPGDPASGLLPYIGVGDGGAPGQGDLHLQSYNFRLCLTQVASNRLAIASPPGYDSADYELLGRYIEAWTASGKTLALRDFLKVDALPNGKTDINNQGAFSTDFIGMNDGYATNNWAARERMWRDHENYLRGFLYFLGHDSRVPVHVRNEMLSWGLCRDEFQDTRGWPHQLYVREARRMVSDYVMLQQNCQGFRVADDSIGLASYTMDSHNCQRVVQNGRVRNEGDVQVGVPQPYPISYRSIVPRSGECENLLVTFALSASHMGFGSCRMEPVFVITSQSAATAAALAINDGVPVQALAYPKLSAQLHADGQLLTWGGVDINPLGGILLDSEDSAGVVRQGEWIASTSVSGFHGANYLHDDNVSKGTKSVRLTPDLPSGGAYDVFVRWTEHVNRATNVPVSLTHAGGAASFHIDQTRNGSSWFPLGTFDFGPGTNGNLLIETSGTTGYVIADAGLWLPVSSGAESVVELFAADPEAREGTNNPASFTFFRSGDLTRDLDVHYGATGTASAGTDFVAPAGMVRIPAGTTSVELPLVAQRDDLIEGDETVVLTLATNADYVIGAFASASAVIRDDPFDEWRLARFTAAELANPLVSGEDADPDQDGQKNLWEFFGGSDPSVADAGARLRVAVQESELVVEIRRSRDAVTAIPTLLMSPDSRTWTAAPVPTRIPEVLQSAPFEILRYHLSIPGPGDHSMFYRLRIDRENAPANAGLR